MEQKDFNEHTRVTVTWRDEDGKLRPGNFYVYKLFKDSMIVRARDKEGLLRKLPYADVLKIVKTERVDPEFRFTLPNAILDEKIWKSRTTMFHASSAPNLGKA
ncbi:hypothetical protein [Thermithiobacillus plumbiphilus]|uniref:Uncharacterized protein n=1 Tax=Thermithiobacillus plumbiphilus TaxID=1729899 RepID=A0ABU9DAL0_9PROT